MPYPSLASVADLAARLGTTPTGDDATRAQAVLDDVSALARKEAATTWVDDTGEALEDVPGDVSAIVLAASRRLFTNPDGFASEQDGDYSYRVDSENLAAGGGTFTVAELEVLRSYRATSGLWSLQIEGSDDLTTWEDGLIKAIHRGDFPS